MRGTRSSTPRAQTLSRRTVPRTAFGPAWSGFRVQGTADSPPSAAGQAEGTTLVTTIEAALVIDATLYTDAGCPWAYSANPALRVLEWRFGDQLRWRLVMIGLREEPSESAIRTFDGERALERWRVWEERYGMPFPTDREEPCGRNGTGLPGGRRRRHARARERVDGVSRAADRELHVDPLPRRRREHPARASCDPRDRCGCHCLEARRRRCRRGVRAATAPRLDPLPAHPRRRRTRRRRRMALVRFTAPSVVFRRDEDAVVAGGWQPLLAYDTLLANFAPTLERMPPPESPAPLLEFFPHGLTTAEVAHLLAEGSDPVPDLEGCPAPTSRSRRERRRRPRPARSGRHLASRDVGAVAAAPRAAGCACLPRNRPHDGVQFVCAMSS